MTSIAVFFGMTHITFTNGQKELFVSGIFREQAYVEMFNLVDRYLSKQKKLVC